MSITAAANALITVPLVKTYISLRGSTDDEVLQTIINDVSDDVQRRLCKRTFAMTTYTDEKYDGDNTGTLLLNHWPIDTVSSLIAYTGGTALTEDSDFVVYADEAIIKLMNGAVFPTSLREVKITYDAGYDTLPADLVYAMKMAVAYRYRIATKKQDGVTSVSIAVAGDTQSTTRNDDDYPAHSMKIFEAYRKRARQ